MCLNIRSDKNQNKNNDENTAADSVHCSSAQSNIFENSDECANNNDNGDDDDDVISVTCVKSDNADTDLDIKTNDVPDMTDSHNHFDNSLGEHDTQANQLTTVDDNIDTTSNCNSDNTTNSFGGSEFIRKQWHRRLRTPVWARCSNLFSLHFILSISCLFNIIYTIRTNLDENQTDTLIYDYFVEIGVQLDCQYAFYYLFLSYESNFI